MLTDTSTRKTPYYSAEEIEAIRRLRDQYKNAPIEHRRSFFEQAYAFWLENLQLPHELSKDGEQVLSPFIFSAISLIVENSCFGVP
jgi:hypothetical protein